jgi:phosphatidylserine decarboxylase
VKFGLDTKLRTETKKKNLNPVWDETFRILVTQSQQKYNVEFDVFDWDRSDKDDLIGTAAQDISELWKCINKEQEYTLTLKNDKLKKAAGTLKVKLTLKDKKTVEREFWIGFAHQFDADGSNTINFAEFCAMMEGVGSEASNQEIQQLFERADLDKSKEVSFEEFASLMSSDSANVTKNPILTKILPEGTMNFIWHVSAKLEEGSTVGELMVERGIYGTVAEKKKKSNDSIMVHNRETGKLEEEKIPDYIKLSLRMMYSTGTGKFAVDNFQIKNVLRHLTEKQGKKYANPNSVKEIDPFIKFHGLNTDEILDPLESFKNFNEFFYRKLKPSSRVIAAPNDPTVAVSPADCRLNVFLSVTDATKVWVKGKNFALKALIQDEQLEKDFMGGSMVIARLAPQDYHRFHCPVIVVLGHAMLFDGDYYTVNQFAIN